MHEVNDLLHNFKADDLKTLYAFDVQPHVWMEVFVIYVSLLCIWYMYKAKMEDVVMRRHFLVGFLSSVVSAGFSLIYTTRYQYVLFGGYARGIENFKSLSHFMSLVFTVAIVSIAVVSYYISNIIT